MDSKYFCRDYNMYGTVAVFKDWPRIKNITVTATWPPGVICCCVQFLIVITDAHGDAKKHAKNIIDISERAMTVVIASSIKINS